MARKTRKKPVTEQQQNDRDVVEQAWRKEREDAVDDLNIAISRFAAAKVEDSWKGGGDPGNIPVIEAQLKLATAHLDRNLLEIRRLLLDNPNLL